jgi:hypothetical protein
LAGKEPGKSGKYFQNQERPNYTGKDAAQNHTDGIAYPKFIAIPSMKIHAPKFTHIL